MVKIDIIRRVAKNTDCNLKTAKKFVETLFALMTATLESGEDIKISGFGVFAIKKKTPRPGRNPNTGEPVTIEGRTVLTFKVSPRLRAVINGVPFTSVARSSKAPAKHKGWRQDWRTRPSLEELVGKK